MHADNTETSCKLTSCTIEWEQSSSVAMERVVLCLAALLTAALAASGKFDYAHQDDWEGTCNVGGTRQSPVAIEDDSTVERDNLIDLVMNLWDTPRTGLFYNTGTSVKFEPDEDEPLATTTNHLGVYEVLQFHVHWGPNDKVGSEHVVDDTPTAAEIHFVHKKRGDDSGTAGDSFAVVGVMAVADESASVSGVWSALKVDEVQEFDGEYNTSVRFSDLLPPDLSYYQYPGSLTTPGCDQVVEWFLLKNTIPIPSAYLEQLREVETDDQGTHLTLNYRATQPLGQREVALHTDSSGARLAPFFSLTLFIVLLLSLF